ncbi:MAG TPA: L,D-transpeptidase [Burkholderiaceae bacterium]
MSDLVFAALIHVLLTRDNRSAPFVIIDKRNAHMWLFDARGGSRGNSPVLLGLARGDDTAPGVGDKPLAHIRDDERTTPAGRFVAEPGRNARGDDVFWVDYDAAVSIHRVHAVNRGERRTQRLASRSAADNRISYGCINVPIAFYDGTLLPLVGGQRPVVYLLPETRPLDTLFNPATKAVAQQVPSSRKGTSWWPRFSTASVSSSRLIMW